jgi:hypothetical protein
MTNKKIACCCVKHNNSLKTTQNQLAYYYKIKIPSNKPKGLNPIVKNHTQNI